METRPATLRSRRVCRFCLSENDPLTYIYERDLSRPFKVPLALQIMSCVAIEVYAADGMPQMICNNCRWNLDRSYKFKMQCKKADEALRAYPMSGVLPRPFPPISNESPDGGVKRGMESRSNEQAKKPRLDNGSELRDRKPTTQKQHKDGNHEMYEEDVVSDQDHLGNDKDDGKLEPGEIRVHACDQCDRTFPLLQSLEIHIQQAHRDRSVQCTECDRMFFNKYDLQKHMSTHSEEKPHVCQICNKQFARANLLQRHEKVHREEVRYGCSHCDREFFTMDELEKHEETVHKANKPFQCNICHKRFTYKQGLERHEMLHNEDKSFVCDYCKESFRSSTKLSRHLQTHAGHRPFVCKLCPRTFLLSHHLTRHMRSHSVEKRHQCEECGKAFKRKESLDVHLLTHIKRTGMALTCEICQETCRNRADYVTHIKQHIEAGEKMGSDGLTPDGKEKMELESDEEEEEEEEEEDQYSDGDDDYQPPSYVAKKLPKVKRMDSEEEMEQAENEHQQTQVVFVRGKDGNVLRKTIKTLMPIQRKDNTQESRGKSIASPQVSTKHMKVEESPKNRVDETEAQVQKIVASVFKEHKIPLKTSQSSQDPLKETIVKQGSQIKEEKIEGSPGSKTVKVIKRIVVRKGDSSAASTSANSSLKEFDASQSQPSTPTTSGPKVTKRVIVRRIIRQGDTTREVIMNPDGTIIDPAELAKLPQGNIIKRVVVKKSIDRGQSIAAMLQAAEDKQIGDEAPKVTKHVPSTVTSSASPKIITVQRMEPKQYVQTISKDDKETKEKLELLEKRVEQQRLKIEELQARKQQETYDADEMITDRHDESEDEQQLPLKRVFVKRKQCIYDEEKEYYDENLKEESQSQNVVVISNDVKLQDQSGNKESVAISDSFESAKVIVIKSNEHAPSVDEMSQELCNILESTESVAKMQETVLNNLTEITSVGVNSQKQSSEEILTTQEEPMEQDVSISEDPANSNHAVKIVITQDNEEVKLEFEQSNQSNIGEEVGHSESGLSTLSTQVLSESNDIFETSDAGTTEDKSQVNLDESVIELSATNETINLNETNDSRDSLEDKLSQMEG